MSNNKSAGVTNLQCDKNFVVRLRSVIEKHLIESGIIKGMLTPADEYSSKGDQAFGKFINSFGNNTIKELNLAPTSPTSIPDTSNLKEGEVYQRVKVEDELPKEHDLYHVLFDGHPGIAWYMDETKDWQSYPNDEQPTEWLRPITTPSSSKEPGSSMEAEGAVQQYLKRRIKELNQADAAFCNDRWADDIPLHQSLKKQLAREESNKVTFGRQELETVLELLNKAQHISTPDTTPSKESEAVERDIVRRIAYKGWLGHESFYDFQDFWESEEADLYQLFLQSKNIDK